MRCARWLTPVPSAPDHEREPTPLQLLPKIIGNRWPPFRFESACCSKSLADDTAYEIRLQSGATRVPGTGGGRKPSRATVSGKPNALFDSVDSRVESAEIRTGSEPAPRVRNRWDAHLAHAAVLRAGPAGEEPVNGASLPLAMLWRPPAREGPVDRPGSAAVPKSSWHCGASARSVRHHISGGEGRALTARLRCSCRPR